MRLFEVNFNTPAERELPTGKFEWQDFRRVDRPSLVKIPETKFYQKIGAAVNGLFKQGGQVEDVLVYAGRGNILQTAIIKIAPYFFPVKRQAWPGFFLGAKPRGADEQQERQKEGFHFGSPFFNFNITYFISIVKVG